MVPGPICEHAKMLLCNRLAAIRSPLRRDRSGLCGNGFCELFALSPTIEGSSEYRQVREVIGHAAKVLLRYQIARHRIRSLILGHKEAHFRTPHRTRRMYHLPRGGRS